MTANFRVETALSRADLVENSSKKIELYAK